MLFDLTVAYPPESHLILSPFELYRAPLAVVGIADGKDVSKIHDTASPGLEERNGAGAGQDLIGFLDNLQQGRERLTIDFPRLLVHQVLAFDLDVVPNNLPEGVSAVPSPAKSKTTTMKTVMCDLASHFLGELTGLARSIQASMSLDSPRVSGYNVKRPLAEYSAISRPASSDANQRPFSPANEIPKPDPRKSIPAHVFSKLASGSSTPDHRSASPPSRVRTPPTTFEEMSDSPGSSPPPRKAEIARPLSGERASMSGFGSGSYGDRERNKVKGRVSIVIGAMFLLAGRWPDAVKEIEDGAKVAKAGNDHLWYAKALDYLLICCLMYAWVGMDFRG
ncbi:MAG: hypothetical protein Q9190_007174 [Brigantiaea leucoxantha]